MSERPADLDSFATFVENINTIKGESQKLIAEADEIDMLHRIAEENALEIPQEEVAKKEVVLGGPQAKGQSLKNNFMNGVGAAQEYKKANLAAMINTQKSNIDSMNDELQATITQLQNGDSISPYSDTREVPPNPPLRPCALISIAIATPIHPRCCRGGGIAPAHLSVSHPQVVFALHSL